MNARPRLYLDIDGVIISNRSPFQRKNINPVERYAPEVAERLGRTGLELVWLSSWGESSSTLSEAIPAFREHRILLPHYGDGAMLRSITHKALALIADLSDNPSPFVWVDDNIDQATRTLIRVDTYAPHLLVRPEWETGIVEADLQQIETFAAEHTA